MLIPHWLCSGLRGIDPFLQRWLEYSLELHCSSDMMEPSSVLGGEVINGIWIQVCFWGRPSLVRLTYAMKWDGSSLFGSSVRITSSGLISWVMMWNITSVCDLAAVMAGRSRRGPCFHCCCGVVLQEISGLEVDRFGVSFGPTDS